MGEKSWEYGGESKGWHNVFDHRWIRSEFIPGWSAAEGGPGPSSHQRDDLTQTRLRPGCGKAVFLTVCLQIDCKQHLDVAFLGRMPGCNSFNSNNLSCDLSCHRQRSVIVCRQCKPLIFGCIYMAVMNPEGGPQGIPATDVHKANAELSLKIIDVRFVVHLCSHFFHLPSIFYCVLLCHV